MNAILFVVLALGQDWSVLASPSMAEPQPETSWAVLPEPATADAPPVAWDVLAIDHEPTPVSAESPRLAALETKVDDVLQALLSHVSTTIEEAHKPLTRPPEPSAEPKPIEQPAAKTEPTVRLIDAPTIYPAEPVCTGGRCVTPQPIRRGLFRR